MFSAGKPSYCQFRLLKLKSCGLCRQLVYGKVTLQFLKRNIVVQDYHAVALPEGHPHLESSKSIMLISDDQKLSNARQYKKSVRATHSSSCPGLGANEDDDDEARLNQKFDGVNFIPQKLTTHDDEIIHEEETNEDDTFDTIVHTPLYISSSDAKDSDNKLKGMDVEGAKSMLYCPGSNSPRNLRHSCDPKKTLGVDAIFGQHADEATYLMTTTVMPLRSNPSPEPPIVLHHEAVDVAVQLKYDRIREESHTENQQFLDSIDEGMKKVIMTKFKKEGLKILQKLKKSQDFKGLLYKALFNVYEADKILLDTYGDTVTIKRPQDGADDDQEYLLLEHEWGVPKQKRSVKRT
ncbi:hypothetical protein Tco_0151133 [Tanacetum coccineum]